MSTDTHYEDAYPRARKMMEEAAPECSRNAPGSATLKREIVALNEERAALTARIKEAQDELNEICRHPTKRRMLRSWGTTDTLGNMDGGYDDTYCTVCGQRLNSVRTNM